MNRVKSLSDIPELYIEPKEDTKMGGRSKKTPELLNKMVQFIWDYQDKHGGETPTLVTVANHVGIKNSASATYFMNMLVDDGRINKISSLPFRVTITDHKLNRQAIDGFQRLRAMKEQFEAKERDNIRENQERIRRADERETDRSALFTAAETETQTETATKTRPVTELRDEMRAVARGGQDPLGQTKTTTTEPIGRFLAARQEATMADRDIKQVMPQLIKVAETRDLMIELVNRGYVVSKR